jgi:hypothetical protein
MGGKGGGGGNYYQQPPDTSGYATPEEAKVTLAQQAPIDYSKYQSNIDVQKAAADATAKAPAAAPATTTQLPEGVSGTSTTEDGAGSTAAKAVLTPPEFWAQYGQGPSPLFKGNIDPTTTAVQI